MTKSKTKKRAWMIPLLFLLPHLAVFCVFNLIPAVAGIYAAFTKWDLGSMPQWVGLDNFKTILTDSNSLYYWQFRWGLKNTCLFVLLVVPIRIIVPLLLALVLNKRYPGHGVHQILFYLPSLLSLSIVMVSWNYMFNPNYGLINTYLNLGTLSWTNTTPYNWIALVIITAWWGTGGNMIVLQSALAGVPRELEEAAKIDRANAVQRFFYVTLPQIKFPLTYVVATTIIAEFNIWGQPYMFNKGGAVVETVNGFAHQSNIMLMQIIRDTGFGGSYSSNPGIASAMALILGAIMTVVSIFQVRMMQKEG